MEALTGNEALLPALWIQSQKKMKQLIAESPQFAYTFRTLNDMFSSHKLSKKQCPICLFLLVQAAAVPFSPHTCAKWLRHWLPLQRGFQTQDLVLSPCPTWAVSPQWCADKDIPVSGCFPTMLVRNRSHLVLCHLLGLPEQFWYSIFRNSPSSLNAMLLFLPHL